MKTVGQESAETSALRILAWLAANDDLMPLFMGATGASAQDLKKNAANPVFLASVLDFVQMDDNWVIQAAEAVELRPDQIASVRAYLPGGDLPNWT
ncbi:DUF3572 domain-containing protein [Gymnodinialimonas sp. 2305UL16-5]|uniref:DUF3572 domain-containing protein n=1 Tax=Gymnodinialimonas mytili TaxID=3126503 RepID=UPI00309E45DE